MASAQRPLRKDEIPLHQRTGLGEDDARHLHPIHQCDDHGHDPQARSQKCCKDDGEEQGGKGRHQIGEAHQ